MQVDGAVEVTLGREPVLKPLGLPVPDIPGRRLPADDDAFGVAAAGVLRAADLSVGWRAAADGSSIELWPLELEQAKMPGCGATIRLEPPVAALPNCVAVSADSSGVVVDFITDVGILYTVQLQAAWLLDADAVVPSPAVFTRTTRPYGFDASAPRLLKAVHPHTVVAALADGSLVRMDRSSALASPSHVTLAEQFSSGLGLGAGLARVFRAGADRVPGRPDLALRSAVAIDVVGGSGIVTLSVGGSLRLWSLKSNACVQGIAAPTQARLHPRPGALVAANGSRVLVAYPTQLQLYEVSGHETEPLKRLGEQAIEIPPELRSWFVTGLVLQADSTALIGFKRNLSAGIFVVRQPGEWLQVGGYNLSTHLDLPADPSVRNIASRVLQSSDPVLREALAQLAPEELGRAGRGPITEALISEIITKLSQASDERTQWLRLDTLCREIEVADAELLAVVPTSEAPGSLGWTIRASYFTLLSLDGTAQTSLSSTGSSNETLEALEIGKGLLQAVPESVWQKLSSRLLSSELLLDRVDDACELVRPYLDSTKLNEVGRLHANKLASAMKRYAQALGPARDAADWSADETASTGTKLSGLGSLAVTEIVHNYASQQSRSFLLLSALSVIGLVEGWFAGESDAEPLRGTLAYHQRLAFVAALDAKHLKSEIVSAELSQFGLPAARALSARIDPLIVLSRLLPESGATIDRGVYARFDELANIIESAAPAAELLTLRGLAALAAQRGELGEALLRRASLARKWPASLAPVPTTRSSWFARVAQYAQAVGATDVAIGFARTGVALASQEEDDVDAADTSYHHLLGSLFDLAIASGEILTAYTALVRRYADDAASAGPWLATFISAVARHDPEAAPKLIATLPFVGLTSTLTQVLADSPVFGSVPSYKLRYAWHMEHEDYVGAASSLYAHLQRDPSDALRKSALFTTCLNALALQSADSQWIVYGDRVITYDEIRGEYNALLDEMAKAASAV